MVKELFRGIKSYYLAIMGVLSIGYSLCECIWVGLLAKMISGVVAGRMDIVPFIITMIVFCVMWELEEYVADVFSDLASTEIESNTFLYYIDKMYSVKPSILKEYNTGYLAGLIVKLVQVQATCVGQIVMYLPVTAMFIIYFGIKLSAYHWIFGLSYTALCLSAIAFQVTGNHLHQKYFKAQSHADAERNKRQLDTMNNINTVQKMQAIRFFDICLKLKNDISRQKCKEMSLHNEFVFCVFKLITYMIVPVTLGIYFRLPSDTITDVSGFISIISLVSVKMCHTIKFVGRTVMFVRKFLSPYKILNDVISENNMRKPLSDIMFDYVELRNVDYSYIRYDEQGASDIHIKIPAFKVSKGDIICVHGESGQGKTTLLHLLSNEIENDNVWINGCNETTKRIDCVFISQDTEVFDMSLRDNLALGKPVSDDVLKEYLEIVGMGDWLRAQEKGLDTLLGERGVFVSTGQRQRINLIRGLLIKDKEIYLLDEPTSNVDDETEEKMIELINRALHGKTAVIVTHRPNIQKICNHSYLFKNGVLSKER